MVGVKGDSLVKVSLKEVAKGPRIVPLDDPLIGVARSLGTSFGN
jgi:hypothetical protein